MKLWMLLCEHREGVLTVLFSGAVLSAAIADGRTGKIPPGCILFLGGLGILQLLWALPRWPEWIGGFFGVSIFLFAGFALTDGKGMGGGDVKLMAAAGLFLGWERILWAFFVGGLLSAGAFALRKMRGESKRKMALGPYLAAGMVAAVVLA